MKFEEAREGETRARTAEISNFELLIKGLDGDGIGEKRGAELCQRKGKWCRWRHD